MGVTKFLFACCSDSIFRLVLDLKAEFILSQGEQFRDMCVV